MLSSTVHSTNSAANSAGEKSERCRIIVTGTVQGVGFRAAACRLALTIGLVGVARNLPDGSLEFLLEGSPDALREFEAWCYSGPDGARVTNVLCTREPWVGEFVDFIIEV